MPRVKVTKPYFDKVREEYPEVNSEFEVEEKRAKVLVNAGVCEIVVEFDDPPNLEYYQTILEEKY